MRLGGLSTHAVPGPVYVSVTDKTLTNWGADG